MLFIRKLALGALVALWFFTARAQVLAEPLPGDPHLVVFPYDENNSYRLLARPNAVTNIVLQPDEKLRVLVLGDTIAWDTAKTGNHVFIKPKFANRTTSGTLITNKRSYQLMLISTTEAGRWYQRVSFEFPDLIVSQAVDDDRDRLQAETGPLAASGAEEQRQPARQVVPASAAGNGPEGVDPGKLNFNYSMKGAAPFKPLTVYDDGQTTYVKLPKAEDVPALFRVKKGGEAELVDYTLRYGDTLVVPRVLDAALLKIGKEEVILYNLNRVKRSWFGSVELGD